MVCALFCSNKVWDIRKWKDIDGNIGYKCIICNYDAMAGKMMRTCPVCDGTGIENYWTIDGEEITLVEYNSLPEELRDCDVCELCEGSGEVEFTHEDYIEELMDNLRD